MLRIITTEDGQHIAARNVKIIDENGSELKGIRSIKITCHPDDVVRAELEVFPGGIDMTAEPRFVIQHPLFGDKMPVDRIVFRDGFPDWIAPTPEQLKQGMIPSWAVLDTMLSLVGYTVREATFDTWSDDEKIAAERWAAAVHLHASDNDDVIVPEKPAVLIGDTWAGPDGPGDLTPL